MQHINAGTAQTAQRGTKATSRALVIAVRPQHARRVPPACSAAIQGNEDQQPFAALGNLEASTIPNDEGAAHEV
jgi:hypothetical protein